LISTQAVTVPVRRSIFKETGPRALRFLAKSMASRRREKTHVFGSVFSGFQHGRHHQTRNSSSGIAGRRGCSIFGADGKRGIIAIEGPPRAVGPTNLARRRPKLFFDGSATLATF
jgi:hypothetical protein